MASSQDDMKRAAALYAVNQIDDGMVVGLGSGSTAAFALEALGHRVAGGLRVLGIPTSEKTAALAHRFGIPLTDFSARRAIDLTIDGADQVERRSLDLIKGGGGSLLREKIVASASARMIVIVDETKLVEGLGGSLPVEIVRFGWPVAIERLAALGCVPRLRRAGEHPFVTDNGNHIVDCVFAEIPDPRALEAELAALVGVFESGLFIGLASQIVVGRASGVEVLEPAPEEEAGAAAQD